MKNAKLARRWSPAWIVVGGLVSGAVSKGTFAVFAEMAKTDDWVLEYQNWITAGVLFVAACIWLAFILVPLMARRTNSDNGEPK